MHDFFMALGVDEIRKRSSLDDKPLRMVKTILHELCKMKVRKGPAGPRWQPAFVAITLEGGEGRAFICPLPCEGRCSCWPPRLQDSYPIHFVSSARYSLPHGPSLPIGLRHLRVRQEYPRPQLRAAAHHLCLHRPQPADAAADRWAGGGGLESAASMRSPLPHGVLLHCLQARFAPRVLLDWSCHQQYI